MISELVARIFAAISHLIITTISSLGYAGVVVMMALESAGMPLPSEIIMPFSGYLVLTGRFTLFGAALAGAVGCLVGSLGAYWISAAGGRPLLERYGRYVLISRHDLALADRWFVRWGNAITFISRLLPVVRTYISFPAGVARMPLAWFAIYTFVGSLIWTYLLAWVGLRLGERWETIRHAFRGFEVVIAVVLLAGAVWWIWRHLKVRDLSHPEAPGSGLAERQRLLDEQVRQPEGQDRKEVHEEQPEHLQGHEGQHSAKDV